MIAPIILLFFLGPTVAAAPSPIEEPEPPPTVVRAEITAYSSSADETDDEPDVNASGTRPSHGSLACPRYYDLGTEFLIDGKRYTCDDRMSKRFPDRFDIWMESKEEAIRFGVRTLPVEVL